MHLRVVAVACLLFVFVLVLPGCGGGSSTTPEVLPPAITAHPSNITVNAGQPATFTVTANGSSPLAYQWQKNDSAISGARSASYTTPATTSADDGSTFKVVVSNAAGSATSNSATLTVNIPQNVSVSVTPKRAAVVITAQSQQFIATVSGDTQNLGVTWSVDGTGGGNATVGSISSSGLYTPPSSGGVHIVTATSAADTGQSASATIAVTDLSGVFTYRNNLARDGTNPQEFALTPSSLNSTTFGKLFSCAVDGNVYTQPLWVPQLTIGGSKHNVLFVGTQHDSVYAFDADASPCSTLWHSDLLSAAHGATPGEIPVPDADAGLGEHDITPEIGVTGTPVINPASNTLFVVSKSEGPSGTFHQRLHALDLATGSEELSGPVDISASVVGAGYDSSGATVTFNPRTENQRAGLALVNGVVYIVWGSHDDADPYHGWVIGYDAANLSQVTAYNVTADGQKGGIWMGGAAPAADSANALYISTGNGTMDHDSNVTPNTDLGDSVVKLTTSSGLTLSDWFSPFNQSDLESQDIDLGSGGVLLLPDQSPGPAHLLVTGGKEGKLYVINRDSMGHFCSSCTPATGDTNIVQSFSAPNAIFGTPAFWQNKLYFAGTSDKLSTFAFDPARGQFDPTPTSQSTTIYSGRGTMPSISSQGTSNGIVWAIDATQFGIPGSHGLGPAVLHAYDASNLAIDLWNSSQAPNSRDQAGDAVKFTVPTVANGRVYIGTRDTVEVYGLLPN